MRAEGGINLFSFDGGASMQNSRFCEMKRIRGDYANTLSSEKTVLGWKRGAIIVFYFYIKARLTGY